MTLFWKEVAGVISLPEKHWINSILPNGTICSRTDNISLLKKEGIIEKNYYTRRAYESVHNKSLSWAISKFDEKKVLNSNG